jgi:hypothetical protein
MIGPSPPTITPPTLTGTLLRRAIGILETMIILAAILFQASFLPHPRNAGQRCFS